jgi:acyl carrier protein
MITEEKIRGLLNEIRPEIDFSQSADFIADGLIDSMDVIQLTALMQSEFGIDIDVLEIVPENFGSVESLLSLAVRSASSNS